MKNTIEVPFQVQNLIDQMLNKKEDIYIRGNFRSRLDQIRTALNESIKKYDAEYDNKFIFNNSNHKKKRR